MTPAASKLEKKELNLPSCRGPRSSSEACSHNHAKDKLMLVFTNPYLPFCVMLCYLLFSWALFALMSHSSTLHCAISSRSTSFFISKAFFSNQPQCCLTFLWIELQIQMLLSCFLIYISIMILIHFLIYYIFVPIIT